MPNICEELYEVITSKKKDCDKFKEMLKKIWETCEDTHSAPLLSEQLCDEIEEVLATDDCETIYKMLEKIYGEICKKDEIKPEAKHYSVM